MSIIYIRHDDGDSAIDSEDRGRSLPVSDKYPLPVRLVTRDIDDIARIAIEMNRMPPVEGQTTYRMVQIPGIGTGSAYADGDAFGTLITWHNVLRAEKPSGTIVGALLFDLDDEGLQVDVPLFTQGITVTADNSAFAPSDADLLFCRAIVPITEFYNWGSNQFGQYTGSPKWLRADGPNLYTQCVIRGAANIAAGALPWLALVVVPD